MCVGEETVKEESGLKVVCREDSSGGSTDREGNPLSVVAPQTLTIQQAKRYNISYADGLASCAPVALQLRSSCAPKRGERPSWAHLSLKHVNQVLLARQGCMSGFVSTFRRQFTRS